MVRWKGWLVAGFLLAGLVAYAEWSTPTDEYGKFVGPGQIKQAYGATTTNTGTTAIDFTLAPGRTFELLAVRVTVTAGIDEVALTSEVNLEVKVDSELGAAYDHIILSEDLSLIDTGLLITYDPPIPFVATDEIDVDYDDTENSGDDLVGVELLYRNIGAAP